MLACKPRRLCFGSGLSGNPVQQSIGLPTQVVADTLAATDPEKAEQALPAAAPQVGEPQRSANPDLRAISILARHGARPEEEGGGGGGAAEFAASPTLEQLSSARGSVSRNYSHPAGGHYCQFWAQYVDYSSKLDCWIDAARATMMGCILDCGPGCRILA